MALFDDMIHHEMGVYVNDMITKSREEEDHIIDLKKVFNRLSKYQLKLNPREWVLKATSGKLLGIILSRRGLK